MRQKWEGVDFDGTLAESIHDQWDGPLGKPIPKMVARVKAWIAEGREVRIFTARVSPLDKDGNPVDPVALAMLKIRLGLWTLCYCGKFLTSTCSKDHNVNRIWDDRARQVVRDTGEVVGDIDGRGDSWGGQS